MMALARMNGWMRLAALLAVALVAESSGVISLLRGHGLWLFIVAMMIAVVCAISAMKKRLSNEAAHELNGLSFLLIGLSIQYNSRLGMDTAVPYIIRAVIVALTLAIFSWMGRQLSTSFAPQTPEERLRP